MSRILVVYYSRSGHTEFVARQIASRCHADLERIHDRNPRQGMVGYLRSSLEAMLGLRPAIERGRRRQALGPGHKKREPMAPFLVWQHGRSCIRGRPETPPGPD